MALTTAEPTTTKTPSIKKLFRNWKAVELKREWGETAIVLLLIGFVFALPLVQPFRRCCETRLHRVYPALAVVNFTILAVTMNQLYFVNFNTLFFTCVGIFELFIDYTETALLGVAALVGLFVIWKFKDRLLETLGIENGSLLVGDFRDWATCWSMKRFQPIELYILRVEGLPAAQIAQKNDVFCEVSLGYNVRMRTRVHRGAGHSCMLKESVQLNFDPFDTDSRLNLLIRHQGAIGSDTIASLQLGAEQVQRLKEPDPQVGPRVLGWAANTVDHRSEASLWMASQFRPFDLIPAGKIYLRIASVVPEDEGGCCGCFDCCCPSRSEAGAALLSN